jgi:hypothetical protein
MSSTPEDAVVLYSQGSAIGGGFGLDSTG